MKRIAFYGKGGIGKSTVAAHVAATFAEMGKKVLFIGCDPKGDSTRTVMGKKIPTLISGLRKNKEDLCEKDFLFTGYKEIVCMETGGPEPGVGCAGRGIITMTEELEKREIFSRKWDIILYDVLGDVVCGGFAVPMRDQYVDEVYIVTSSEYMALYAANNIMKGICKFSEDQPPVLKGMIYNRRNNFPMDHLLAKFSEATRTPVTSGIPFLPSLVKGEMEGKTLVELEGNKGEKEIFTNLAREILYTHETLIPVPMGEEQLDEIFVSAQKVTDRSM